MKINIYPGIMLLIAFLFMSCKKDIFYEGDFFKSEKAWQNFKASSGNSYRYMTDVTMVNGYVSETIITVKNGQVVGRSFFEYKGPPGGSTAELVLLGQWEENASSLGSHTTGAEPVTLDEIYHRANSDWLKKREHVSLFFETKNDGMISLCGYIPDGCYGYCLRGISIDYIEKL